MILVLTIIAVSSGCSTGTGTDSVNREADVADLRHAKIVKWKELYDTNDVDGLSSFLAHDFVRIGGPGIFTTKSEEIESLLENPWDGPDDFTYTIEEINFLNDDAAIVYGIGTSTRVNSDGDSCHHSYISSNSFRRIEEGTWHPVTSHVSDVSCTPFDE